jgi:hypothetical protein
VFAQLCMKSITQKSSIQRRRSEIQITIDRSALTVLLEFILT